VAKGQEKMVGMMSNLGIAVAVVVIVIWLLLIWLISRKGCPVAKWIYVALAVIFLLFAVVGLTKGAVYGTVPFVLAIVQDLLSLAALWFIFQPDAKAWFNEGRTADPADL
jgi:heme A synthase